MANSPGTSDEVRCGMCGKQNPADSAACKYCGARLRPMTAEELGLTPSQPTAPLRWPEERKKPEPPAEPPKDTPEDPLASLRHDLMDADDATIIGPSASKDRIRRQDLFENIEPDFMVGKPSEAPAEPEEDDTSVSADIPDWLRDASKTGDTGPLQAPSGQVPDWLMEETRTSEPPTPMDAAAFDAPDWLGKPVEDEADELPDWMGGDTARSQATRPMPAVDDDKPDWMQNLDQPDEEPPAAGIPDWMLDETPGTPEVAAPTDDALEWLRSVPPPEPASDATPGLPDWLSDATGNKRDEPATPSPDDKMVWLEAPDPSAPPQRGLPQTAELGVPDWLQDADEMPAPPPPVEQPLPAADLDLPDWMSEAVSTSAEPPPPLPSDEEPAGETPLGVPDWLKDAEGSQEPLMSSGMPDWLASAAPEPQAEETSDADWLRPPQDEVMEPEAPAQIEAFDTPDWLRPPSEMEHASQDEPTSEAEAPAEAAPEVPAWLSGLGLGAVEPSEEAPAEETPASEIAMGVPDWLSDLGSQPAAESEAHAESEQEAAPEPEIPSWMTGLGVDTATPAAEVEETTEQETDHETAEASEPAPEVPDWLAGLGGVPAAPAEPVSIEAEAPAEAQPEVPDWLAGLGGAPAAPAESVSMEAEAPSEPAPEVPDWLAGLGGAPAAPAEPVSMDAEAPSEPAPEVPDWLAGLSGEPAAPAESVSMEAEAPSEPAPEVPDWLTGLGDAPAAPAEAVSMEAEAPSEPAPEVPDWLAGLGGAPAAPAEAVSMEAEAPSEPAPEVPDWLTGLGSAPAAPTAHETPATEPAVADETPDWLSGLGAEPAAPAAASDETPDWLADLGGAPAAPPAAETPVPMPAASDETPDWLSGIDTPAASPVDDTPDWLSDFDRAPAPAAESPSLDFGDTPDWLADLDQVLGNEIAPAPAGGEDLLGMQDFMLPTDERQEAVDLDAGNLPEWLREVDPDAEQRVPSMPTGSALDVPAELADLRFESITEHQSMEPTTEKVGALKDVTGVIRPEIIFDGRTLEVGKLSDELVVTDHQRKRIETLEGLLERQARGVVVVESAAAYPIVRWLIALLILAVTLVAALMAAQGSSFLPTPAAGGDVESAAELVNKRAAGENVVMVIEYDPETAAEMQPIAAAMLEHLASRNVRVYLISTRPAGPALAQAALAEVTATDATANWVNLGYLTGGAKGISALVTGNPLVTSPLAADYQGQATNLEAARLSDLNPQLLIIVSSRWEDLRAWIEQTGGIQVETIAATSLSSAPMVYPYEKSGQIDVVLSGVNDAVQYRAKINSPISASASAAWNGQALGGIVSALMIVGGSVVYGLRALRQQEQD